MQNFSVAIIKSNKLTYSNVDMTHSRFQRDNLENDLDDYLELVKVNNLDELMGKIIDTLQLTPEILAHTTTCKEDTKFIYQICHLVDDDKARKQNNICIRLTNNCFRVVGDAVLMKAEIMSDGTTKPCNITLDDVIDLYQECLIKTCVKVYADGKMDDVKYIFNPIDWVNPNFIDNFRFHEIQFADKIMMFFIELNPVNNILNTKASILYGKPIFGDVIIAMRYKPDDIRQTEHEYYNVNKHTMSKLVSVFSAKSEKLKINDEGTTKRVVNNFLITLENKYNLYKSLYNDEYSTELLDHIKQFKSLNEISQEMTKAKSK
jgi:hypothetical protein